MERCLAQTTLEPPEKREDRQLMLSPLVTQILGQLRFLSIALLILAFVNGSNLPGADPTLRGFAIAEGWTLQKVAGEALVRWPVVADWDEEGNLLVIESGGVAWPIQQHNELRLHKVIRLLDDDGDGSFDRRILVADNLPFAEGILCVDNRILVAAPPNIWELTDADRDGICEERRVWFDGQTVTNCANDLHGPYLGRDSWIYWCKGAFAEQTHELTDGTTLRDRAAHIFRRRLEGGPIESLIAGGMDNPVELAFTPQGEKFFTSTFLQHPGDGKRDGIAHAVYGSVFGKDHDVIEDLIQTGPLMPIMTHLGPAAPSGLLCLRDAQSSGVRSGENTLVSAQFNLHKVATHELIPHTNPPGYRTADRDLLVSDQIDFHPTDVLEDADGSLIVVDTGGWYDLCCPTSRVDQKVAAGGIYRLARKASNSVSKERINWKEATVDRCLDLLSDQRPWVRRRACFALKEFGNQVLPSLMQLLMDPQQELQSRLDALWVLSWIGSDQALGETDRLFKLADSSEHNSSLVRAACHIVGLHRYAPARQALEGALANKDARIRLAAAEALGRIGDPESIPPIMQCISGCKDRLLMHSCTFAIIEIAAPAPVADYLNSHQVSQKLAAMVALDQLGANNELDAEEVLAAAVSTEERLSHAALNILEKHTEWAALASDLLQRWRSNEQPHPDSDFVPDSHLAIMRAWRDEAVIQELAASWLHAAKDRPADSIQPLIEVWRDSEVPETFVAPLIERLETQPVTALPLLEVLSLDSGRAEPIVQAIHTAIGETDDLQMMIALTRLLPKGQKLTDQRLLTELVGRGNYATLAKLELGPRQARELATHLDQANAFELPDLLVAISSAEIDALDFGVLRRLYGLPVARTLGDGFLESLYRNRSSELQTLATETDALLQLAPKNVRATVSEILGSLPDGDPVRGLKVFRDQKANCSACHQMGYIGGKIGPELTRIGKTRTSEALMEAILFPSLRIEQGFRPVKVLTVDGQIVNGLVISQNSDELELQIAADKTIRLSKRDIESQQPGEVSIMPSGMREVLSPQELADLMALLKAAQ